MLVFPFQLKGLSQYLLTGHHFNPNIFGLLSLAHTHTHTLETIKEEENGTGRKWPEVWTPIPAVLLL